MKNERILNCLGDVDENYIAEAAPSAQKKHRPIWVKWGAMAACLAVVLVGGLAARRQMTVPTEDTATGSIAPGGAYVSGDFSDSAKEEAPLAGIADDGSDLSGDLTGYLPTISAFGETKMDSDISVDNGGVLFSDALTGAMAQYGGDVDYRVIVELFSDGVELDCTSEAGKAEMDRFFADEGYTVVFENYFDGYVNHNYFTLHATLEQLENFPASEQYGYCVMLYGERLETTDGLQNEISGTAIIPSVAAAGTDDMMIAKTPAE
jgi:hypothetical protein